jgi:asparagine synthase (glutamine-hydrolysing)
MDFRGVHDSIEDFDWRKRNDGANVIREGLIKTYLQVNGLAQTDRLWMAKSVEGRNLFVDYKLVEIALADPLNIPNNKELGKKRFIDYIEIYLKRDILIRKKRGFTPPVAKWSKEIYNANNLILGNSMLINDGVLPPKAQQILSKPLTILGRPRLIWLELATLEFWYRGMFEHLSHSSSKK